MANEFTLTVARINDSITRIPDRLSNSKGEEIRAEYARNFGLGVLGHEQKDGALYMALPFQTALLTDPVLYIVAGGMLLLDHPTRDGAYEFAFGERAHVIYLPQHWSLYESRIPRIITCARKRENVPVGWMVNRLTAHNFHGPFAKTAA